MQKALVITSNSNNSNSNVKILNNHLEKGWKFIGATPIGGGGRADKLCSLVIIGNHEEYAN